MPRLAIPQDELAKFCRANHIQKLSLFGSTLKGTARPDSDVVRTAEVQYAQG